MAFDRFGAASVVTALQEIEMQVVNFGRGYVSMSPAANAVVRLDPAGNIKPDRSKSGEKIDGIVALTMAVGRWMAKAPEAEIDLEWV